MDNIKFIYDIFSNINVTVMTCMCRATDDDGKVWVCEYFIDVTPD